MSSLPQVVLETMLRPYKDNPGSPIRLKETPDSPGYLVANVFCV